MKSDQLLLFAFVVPQQTQNVCITFIQRRLNVMLVQHCINVIMFCIMYMLGLDNMRQQAAERAGVIGKRVAVVRGMTRTMDEFCMAAT